jgi:hypothetical protein
MREGIETCEVERHIENGETWRRLQVKFPPGFPTHCSEQIFYFSEGGLLQRLDYLTEVAGGVASHYCFDHATFGGLTFPMLRRVVRRTAAGSQLSGPPRFWSSLRIFVSLEIGAKQSGREPVPACRPFVEFGGCFPGSS